ncbi:MAG: TolC family protein [Deltaproteobacteria bacterium]|nr:TolC family protein [Deltaproteobacteria bacterium]
MGKSLFPLKYRLLQWILILGLLTGCRHTISDTRYDTIAVPEERLTQVKAFDWQAMADPQPPDISDEVVTIDSGTTELSLSLNQCRAMVMQNNLDLQVQWFNPKIAEEAVNTARAVFEPLAFSSFNFYKSETPVFYKSGTTPSRNLVKSSSSQSESWDVGLNIPLSTGGQIRINMPRSKSDSDETSYTSYNNDLTLSLNQPLLRNSGPRVNTHLIRIAGYNALASRARIKLETMNALATVDKVYWRLYAARQELLVRKQEYDLAVAQLERAKRMVEVQTWARIEILRAESAAAERLEGIILAERTVRDRQRELKRILNEPDLEMDTPVTLVPVVELNPAYIPLDKKRVQDYALNNRMELLELELQIATQASTVDLEQNRLLPALALSYAYNINGLGKSGNEAFDMVLDNEFVDHRFGLSLEIPIGNEVAKSRLRQAVLRKRRALLTKKQRELTITQEVLGTIDQLNANWQRVLVSRKSAQLAEQTLLAEQRQHELGLQTSNEVLSAQARFANARSAELRALVEYQIAQIDLAYASGCLLDAARIQWQETADDFLGE